MSKEIPNKLELSNDCCLEFYDSFGVSLCYFERQADQFYRDLETEIDIDKEKAVEIIEWLKNKYQLNPKF